LGDYDNALNSYSLMLIILERKEEASFV